MKKSTAYILFIAVVLLVNIAFCNSNNSKQMVDKTVVSTFDLEQYLGKWYEIARFDHKFERGLVGITATYSLREDGKIAVVNSGYKGTLSGEYSEAVGKAKVPNPETEPAKLKVSFFWFFYADYYVLELDPDYQWAVVGSKSDKYLWILSRTPQLEKQVYDSLLNRIEERGYATSDLILVDQKGSKPTI